MVQKNTEIIFHIFLLGKEQTAFLEKKAFFFASGPPGSSSLKKIKDEKNSPRDEMSSLDSFFLTFGPAKELFPSLLPRKKSVKENIEHAPYLPSRQKSA